MLEPVSISIGYCLESGVDGWIHQDMDRACLAGDRASRELYVRTLLQMRLREIVDMVDDQLEVPRVRDPKPLRS